MEILQIVRIADVVIVAPILLVISENKNLNNYERAALKILGVGTLLFNLANFIKEKQPLEKNIN